MTKKRKRTSGNTTAKDVYVDVNPCSTSEDFIYDEIDTFHKDKDSTLLAAGTSYKKSIVQDTEEVLGVASDSDEDNEKIAEYEDRLKRFKGISHKALGNYSSDEEEKQLEDDMLESDLEDEELEEYEAMRIQKDSLKYLNEEDFLGFSSLQEQNEADSKVSADIVSKTEQAKIVDSDECHKVTDEMKSRLKQLITIFSEEVSSKQRAKAILLLKYCMNMSFFLHMKSSGEDVHNHPVIGKILQFKKAIGNFESFFKISKTTNKDEKTCDAEEECIDEDDLHRPINKTIIQNRGIVPYRKKENKNPRVKHRRKYEKAIMRRKGMVPDLRKKSEPYEGELTGINTGIVRSTKFK